MQDVGLFSVFCLSRPTQEYSRQQNASSPPSTAAPMLISLSFTTYTTLALTPTTGLPAESFKNLCHKTWEFADEEGHRASSRQIPQLFITLYSLTMSKRQPSRFLGTFVMPSGSRKPSLFQEPKLRMRLERHRLKTIFRALQGRFIYKFFLRSRPWPKIHRRKIVPEAKRLYEKMYNAFADGDLTTLKDFCHEGLLASFRTRINVRPSKEGLQWKLHRYIGSPRIVSTNIIKFSDIEGSAVYQVVVKIKSIQSLNTTPETGMASDAIKEKKIEEHLVLQRMMLKGKEEEWKIWGTTDESNVKDVLKDDARVAAPAVGKR